MKIFNFIQIWQAKKNEEEVRKYLDFVKLDLDFNTTLQSMSGGEKQRLAIVCGIVKDAKLFIFDEPTAYLDEENKKIILSIIQQLAHTFNKMVLVATHDNILLNIADQVYKIVDMKIVHLRESAYQIENNNFKRKKLDEKVLRNYVYKKNKKVLLIIGFLMGVVLAGFTISFIYGHFYQEKDEQNILESIHYQGAIVKKDNKEINVTEQTRIKQQFNMYQVYPYTTISCNLLIDNDTILNNVQIKPYLPKTIQKNDILLENTSHNNSSIYASYEIYHYYKDKIFQKFNIENFNEIEVQGILKPGYDQEKALYIPYYILNDSLIEKGIELSNTPVKKIIVELNSLKEYSDISKNISDQYVFETSPNISLQSRFIELFGASYLIFIWVFVIIVFMIYKTYLIIGDKRNIALLQTLGVSYFQLVKMKLLEETILSSIMFVVASCLVIVFSLLLIPQLCNMLLACILTIFINVELLLVFNLVIYILFIKHYSPEFLLK